MAASPLRWGICAAGMISNDFCGGLKALSENEHVIKAVAASSIDRAQAFANRLNIRKAYGSYSDLAKDPDVDVVYVGSINTKHVEHVKLMLNGGKHVLCEKPLCITVKEAEELVSFAAEKNLFLMEAVWSRFFPAYEMVEKAIADGDIGEVHHVQATFGINREDIDRLSKKELGGGATYDLGIYTIQLAQFIFKEVPSEVSAAGYMNKNGVDSLSGMILKYSKSKLATLACSMKTIMPNEACISGSKGYIRIHQPFWCPTRITINDIVHDISLPEVQFPFNFQNSVGLSYEAQEVRRCLLAGKKESSRIPHSESIQLAKIIKKLRNDLGYEVEMDKE